MIGSETTLELSLHRKQPGWETRLNDLVRAATTRPFGWGSHDCALFAADCVLAQTGIDLAADWRGQYDSLEGGLRLIHSLGFRDQVELAAARLPELPVAFARLGDIAAVDLGTGMALAVVGGHFLTGPMPVMRGSMPRSLAVRAFAVGWQP